MFQGTNLPMAIQESRSVKQKLFHCTKAPFWGWDQILLLPETHVLLFLWESTKLQLVDTHVRAVHYFPSFAVDFLLSLSSLLPSLLDFSP